MFLTGEMDKKKVAVPLVCHGHSRPVVDLFYSPITPDGFFLISASKGTRYYSFSPGIWLFDLNKCFGSNLVVCRFVVYYVKLHCILFEVSRFDLNCAVELSSVWNCENLNWFFCLLITVKALTIYLISACNHIVCLGSCAHNLFDLTVTCLFRINLFHSPESVTKMVVKD